TVDPCSIQGGGTNRWMQPERGFHTYRAIKFVSARERLGMRVLCLLVTAPWLADSAQAEEITASSHQTNFAAAGAVDRDRFSFAPIHAWKGQPGESNWWWQIQFSK